MFSEAGYTCIPAILPILKEVGNSVVPDDNNQDQESNLVLFRVVANIFQKIIELLARCLRKEPEEGQLVRSGFFCFLLNCHSNNSVFCFSGLQKYLPYTKYELVQKCIHFK